jgi:hypothetical protein
MELIPPLRRLWRRRWALAAGMLAAVALGVAAGSSPPARAELAWTSVALDTPRSQLVDSAPKGYDSLPWRASLIVHLMARDTVRTALAQRLGVPPDHVTVADPALAVPLAPASMPKKAADVASATVAPYVLTLQMPDSSLPVISVAATAPQRAGAVRLAQAAVAILASQGSKPGTYKSIVPSAGGPRLQPFLVQQAAPLHMKTLSVSKLPVKGVVAPVFLLLVWLACLALVPRGPRLRLRPAAA